MASSGNGFKVEQTYALPKTKRKEANEIERQLAKHLSGDKDVDICVLLKLLSERL